MTNKYLEAQDAMAAEYEASKGNNSLLDQLNKEQAAQSLAQHKEYVHATAHTLDITEANIGPSEANNACMIIKHESTDSNNAFSARPFVLSSILFRIWSALDRARKIKPTAVNANDRIQRAEEQAQRFAEYFKSIATEYECFDDRQETIISNFVDRQITQSAPQFEGISKATCKELGIPKKAAKKLRASGVPKGFSEKVNEAKQMGYTALEITRLVQGSMASEILAAKARHQSAYALKDEFTTFLEAQDPEAFDPSQPNQEVNEALIGSIGRAVTITKKTAGRAIFRSDWSDDFKDEIKANHLELKRIQQVLDPLKDRIDQEREEKGREGYTIASDVRKAHEAGTDNISMH